MCGQGSEWRPLPEEHKEAWRHDVKLGSILHAFQAMQRRQFEAEPFVDSYLEPSPGSFKSLQMPSRHELILGC